jgi:hypothetical protein
MSTERQPLPAKRRVSTKIWWLLGLGLFVMALAGAWLSFVIYAMGRVPQFNGEVTFTAGPGDRLFLGNELIGTTEVKLGLDNTLVMGLKLPSRPDATELGRLVADGKEIVNRSSFGGTGGNWGDTKGEFFLLRGQDGMLDQVCGMTYELHLPERPPAYYLLLLRVRGQSNQASTFFSSAGHGSTSTSGSVFAKALGQSPSRWETHWRFAPTNPPEQYKEEIRAKGLWEPAGNGKRE